MKLLLRLLLLIFFWPIISIAQNDDTKVWKMVDMMPQFPGGDAERVKYVSANLKYPHHESENNIQGKVYCSFVIDANGKINDIKILKGVANGEGLSQEAIRVIGAMPNWIPGEQNGKKVAVEMMLPINFAIEVKADVYLPPIYTGGMEDLKNKIAKATKSILKGDEGLILISFKVNNKGIVSNIIETRKLKLNSLANENVLKIFAELSYLPATLNGLPIDTTLYLDIFISNSKLIMIDNSIDRQDSLRSLSQLAFLQGAKNAEQNDYKKATEFYSLALHYGNHSKDLYYNAGAAYFNLKDTTMACESWLRASKRGDKEATEFLLKTCPDLAKQYGIIAKQLDTLNGNKIFEKVDEMPRFPGGDEGFLTFIAMNFHYPNYERENGIQGKVFVEFVLTTDGSITDVRVIRGVVGGEGLDKEAVRVMYSSPKWEPGKLDGILANVYYRIPVACSLK